MDVVLEESGEEIVLYFEIESEGLGAQTFGNALISFDEIYRAISSIINPGLDIEIEFIRSDQGSIRAILKSIKKDATTLWGAPFALIVFPFLLNIFSNMITSDAIKIIVNDDSYIVEHGSERVVLPRDAEQKVKKAERDPAVRQAIRNFFTVVDSDPNVKAVDFRSPKVPEQPTLPIERGKFAVLREIPELSPPELPKERKQPHLRQTVTVVTAVLEKARSKWKFIWSGQRISADIQDDGFFDKLARHDYEFGQGDSLVVDLLAEQELDEFVGAYVTKRYHVTKVHSHRRGPKQANLFGDDDD